MKRRISYYLFLIVFVIWLASSTGNVLAVVDLLYFMATPGSTSILLSWETATEFDTAGFYIQRGLAVWGPFTTITSRIISIGDPFTGHYYQYEDTNVEIGIQYYYILQILNADGTSDFTAPVGAIILTPTTTPTFTPTRTQIPVQSPTSTLTLTSTSLASATLTAIFQIPTSTVTFTLESTATTTRTPTTTLVPISISGVDFPVLTTTPSPTSSIDKVIESSPEVTEPGAEMSITPRTRVLSIVGLVIFLWVALALFLFIVIRHISRDAKNNL
jgi:hypothetical protein